MRIKAAFALSVAFTTCALVYPSFASARNMANDSKGDPGATPAASADAEGAASQMVPAEAVLKNAIDAKKVHQGDEFKATLSQSVQLKNGTELPRDTVLVGTIATDNMQSGGTSTLALRFTKAQLKDGKVIPIQADIMGIAGPNGAEPTESYNTSFAISPWDGTTTRVDEPGAVSGFDFHGRIGGQYSGQFVSTKKDNVKLAPGSQIALAIAARPA
ncbi:MAG TPA: hypothetical protein VMT38_10810 [Terracidiphilus sp.]|nr:hypothetical protein [Terracidiphilus sp.]